MTKIGSHFRIGPSSDAYKVCFITFDFQQVAKILDPIMHFRLNVLVLSSILYTYFAYRIWFHFVLFKAPKECSISKHI